MTRARRGYRGPMGENGDAEEQEEVEASPEPPMELRYVYTAAHAELQWRVPNGEWQAVRSVKLENADEGETIEGEAENVTGQAQIEAKPEEGKE